MLRDASLLRPNLAALERNERGAPSPFSVGGTRSFDDERVTLPSCERPYLTHSPSRGSFGGLVALSLGDFQ